MCSGDLTRATPAPVFDVSGGVVAEEMGLGKTVELVAYEFVADVVLLLCLCALFDCEAVCLAFVDLLGCRLMLKNAYRPSPLDPAPQVCVVCLVCCSITILHLRTCNILFKFP